MSFRSDARPKRLGAGKPTNELARICFAHRDLVLQIARSLRRRVGPRADFEELVADGNVGLVRAALAWFELPPERRSSDFKAWAATFIRRAMVDGLRRKAGRQFDREQPVSLDAPAPDSEVPLVETVEDIRSSVFSIVEARERLVEKALAPKPKSKSKSMRRPLTSNEIEVLVGAAMGESAKATAARLGKSEGTVKTQRVKAREKLGATDMTNAVFLALKDGLLDRVA